MSCGLCLTVGLRRRLSRAHLAIFDRRGLRTLVQYLEIRPFFYGDYYPMTSYSQARERGWAINSIDRFRWRLVVGCAPQAHMKPLNSLSAVWITGLVPVTDLDTGRNSVHSGKALLKPVSPSRCQIVRGRLCSATAGSNEF